MNNKPLMLGKLPAKKDSRDLDMLKYFTGAPIPQAPKSFGHYLQFAGDWLMLGNNKFGCCVPAAIAHLIMMWAAMWKKPIPNITEESNLACYSEITALMGAKFDPTTGENDTGCDMHIALNWLKNTGYMDADGNRHPIAGYGSINPNDINNLINCVNLFDGVDIGFQVTQRAMNQFQMGRPWDTHFVMANQQIIGGHSIPIVGLKDNGNLPVITWEKEQDGTQPFFQKYNDEAYCIVTNEQLNEGKTPEGFQMDQFLADLAQVSTNN